MELLWYQIGNNPLLIDQHDLKYREFDEDT